MSALRLPAAFLPSLRCPHCRQPLIQESAACFRCTAPNCGREYPVVAGVPILIDESRSVFNLEDFIARRDTYFRSRPGRLRALRQKLLPSISANIDSADHYRRLAQLLLERRERPQVLIIGGGILGEGMAPLLEQPALQLLESDVSITSRTMLVCDAHDLPFADGTFDGIVAQAVLEHVVDPYRCVEEIHRVLAPDGLVYAETPFMQQVHAGRYDFTRFTHLGHRRLFRHFEEIESGVICGPGMALAWAYRYFLLSFVSSPLLFRLVDVFAHLTAFWLKYLDPYLAQKPGALDAASGYFFLGRRSTQILSDKELVRLYRGRMQ
ncbi:MAG: methyltransferase domain-containing protein [Caldilineae bacterium]|nr:MAG: methyltransferase domain-containing protein [Caldilineae bacterium]